LKIGHIDIVVAAAIFISATVVVMLQAGRSRDRVPMRWIFSNLPNPSGCTMALGSTQPLTETSTRNLKKKKKETWG
jgi:hypothetical protein